MGAARDRPPRAGAGQRAGAAPRRWLSAPALFAATTSGLYTSANAGQSWSHVAGLPQGSALALATLAQQPTWLYASVGAGVYHSTDGGLRWQVVAQGLTGDAQGLAVIADRPG